MGVDMFVLSTVGHYSKGRMLKTVQWNNSLSFVPLSFWTFYALPLSTKAKTTANRVLNLLTMEKTDVTPNQVIIWYMIPIFW